MRVLEICPFSSNGCGVFNRVLSESKEFEKRRIEVTIFSSDRDRTTGNIIQEKEIFEGKIKIKRFKSKYFFKSFSDNVINWYRYGGARKEVFNLVRENKVDVIITHLLHPHTANISRDIKALKKINPELKFFVVPHAPFNIKRKFPLNLLTYLWKKFSTLKLQNFDWVVSIAKWEIPYLIENGVKKEKIISISNGIPDIYFEKKKTREESLDVLFIGRVSSVKRVEDIISVANLLPKVGFSIMGPGKEEYILSLRKEIKNDNVSFLGSVYDLNKKIEIIDKHKIFLLPSEREAMPQVLIEALARGKLVIASNTDGAKEIIIDGFNGYLYPSGDINKLSKLISSSLKINKVIKKNALETAKKYSWDKLIKSYINKFQ